MSFPHNTIPAHGRVALFGGSFDPVHLGHLIIAEDAFIQLKLDAVVFLPAWHAPLKEERPWLSTTKRINLLERALAPYPAFHLSTFETNQKRRVYAIESVSHFRDLVASGTLYFLIGGDQEGRLGEWKDIQTLARMATLVSASRGPEDSRQEPPVPVERLEARRCDISSKEIRQRAGRGLPFRSLLPNPVAEVLCGKSGL